MGMLIRQFPWDAVRFYIYDIFSKLKLLSVVYLIYPPAICPLMAKASLSTNLPEWKLQGHL